MEDVKEFIDYWELNPNNMRDNYPGGLHQFLKECLDYRFCIAEYTESMIRKEIFKEQLEYQIERFIKENGYNLTSDEIFTEYNEKYKKEISVSRATKKVIEHFILELEKI